MNRKLSMAIVTVPVTVALGLAVACAAERAGSGPASPPPDPAPSPSSALMGSGPVDASADASPVDAGAPDPAAADAATDSPAASTRDAAAGADASGRVEPPLVLKGVRRCTADEDREDACAEGEKRGLCLDSYCVTTPTCNRYCTASGAHSAGECRTDPKECGGVRECLKVIQETNAQCEQLRRQLIRDCVATICPVIRTLGPR
jgi:hypothetical protein